MFRYRTQPVEGSGNEGESARPQPSHSRHHTQPVTPGEKEAASVATQSPPRSSGTSIAERYTDRDAMTVTSTVIQYEPAHVRFIV